jgi:iron complex transport system substrate-binding protein
MACGFDLTHNVGFAQALHTHPRAGALRAVRQGQLFALDANRYFSRPAPGLVEGAELLHAIFHEGREVPGKSARVPVP